MSVLTNIQNELKAPKSKRNTFGNYNYRSCEDILEAAKPILKSHNATLFLYDSLELVGDWHYVKATAVLTTSDGEYQACAYARETSDKKGMDGSQITGTASSYARKYALNGLFLIDDTKDPDTDEYTNERKNRRERSDAEERIEQIAAQTIGVDRAKALADLCQSKNVLPEVVCARYGVEKLSDLTEEQHRKAVSALEKSKG